MGFVEKMAEKGAHIIKERLRKEYENAGSIAWAEMETISLEEAVQAGKMLKDIAIGLWGGRITPESLWILRLKNQGFFHWYIQPFTKIALLPGEHHAILPGSVPATAGLEQGGGFFSKPRWWSENEGFVAILDSDATLGKICKKVKWMWQIPGGTRVEYKAPLQFRNIGNARTHVALKGGNYGGNNVGFRLFVDICYGLTRYLSAETDRPEGTFRTTYGYSQIALSELSGPGPR